MGTLRSKIRSNEPVNGVTLGEPRITLADGTEPDVGSNISELFFAWDDSALPNGELLIDGTIVPDRVVGM